jgi:uncharacterized protein (DUF4213/DUF364 family)
MEEATIKQNNLIETVLATLPDGDCVQVCIGLRWTAVVLDVQGELRCGLASTFRSVHEHGEPDVPQAGLLEKMSGIELAALALKEQLALVSVGVAAINALLPRQPDQWKNHNAEAVIAKYGASKSVALVGHFPFIPRLRTRVGELTVLEQRPRPGDIPATFAEEIIPQADVVAITGTTLINHTLIELLSLCSSEAIVILLGPSTFLSPVLFDYGIDLLCGSVVTDIDPVLATVRQGGNFRQVHRAGVQLVSMSRTGV